MACTVCKIPEMVEPPAGGPAVKADGAVDLPPAQRQARDAARVGARSGTAAAQRQRAYRRARGRAPRPVPPGSRSSRTSRQHGPDRGKREAAGDRDRLQHWAYQSVARIPNPAQSVCPAEYQHAGEAITEVGPTPTIAASPSPRSGFLATTRHINIITATRMA